MTGVVEFFNPNSITYESTFTFTTAALENAPFLYDNDIFTMLSSDGSADGVAEVWSIQFDSAKTVDFIGVFSHNFKTGTIKYLDVTLTPQDFTSAISFVNNTATSSVYYVTQVVCYGLQISVTHTIDGSEKSCGELRALDKFAELTRPVKFTPQPNVEADIKKKYDGGSDKIINGIKYGFSFDFDLSDAEAQIYLGLSQRGRSFYIYAASCSTDKGKPYFEVESIYQVVMTNKPKLKAPENLIDGIMWTGTLEVDEV